MESKPTDFILLASPRTGSTMLVDMFQQHPSVHMAGEIFNKKTNDPFPNKAMATKFKPLLLKKPGRWLDDVWFRQQPDHANHTHRGFKLLYQQALRANRLDILIRLRRRPLRIIHLHRDNAYHQLVSLTLARKTQTWHRNSSAPPPPSRPITLNTGECLQWFTRMERSKNIFGRWFSSHPILNIRYEDLVGKVSVWPKIQDFVGIPSLKITPGTQKIMQLTYSQIVANHDQLAHFFKSTPYGWFFSDE